MKLRTRLMIKALFLVLLLLLTGCKPAQLNDNDYSLNLTLCSNKEIVGIDDSLVTRVESDDPCESEADIIVVDLIDGVKKINFDEYKLLAIYQAQPYLIIDTKDNHSYGNCGYLSYDERSKVLMNELRADLNLYSFKEYSDFNDLLAAFGDNLISSILVSENTYQWYQTECDFELYENENLNSLYRLKNGYSFIPGEGIFVKQEVIDNYLYDMLKITTTVRQSANSDSSIQNVQMASECYDATNYYLSLFDLYLNENMIVR